MVRIEGEREYPLEVVDVGPMIGTEDLDDARRAVVKLLVRAKEGLDLHDVFDSSQCHEAFSYKDSVGNSLKVWRLWIGGKIRIYFVYLPGRIIVVLRIAAKRSNVLSSGEKSEITDLALAATGASMELFDLRLYGNQ